MLIVLGYVRKQGEFEGRKFDNMMIYCQYVNPDPGVTGVQVEVIKCPYSAFESAGLSIGDQFLPYRDRFGRVTDILKQ